jgi:quercetin dioxygenase-like cupin family protein
MDIAPVQLHAIGRDDGPGGVVWSAPTSQLHVNLVDLPAGGEMAEHVNREVDVVVVVLEGAGELTVDGSAHDVEPLVSVVVPSGARRRVRAGAEGLRYLTAHRARGPLTVGRSA